MFQRILLLFAMTCAAPTVALPAAASNFKTFRDWFAACDNLRNCSAYGFDVEFAGGGSAYLRIERGGAPDAPVKATVTVNSAPNATFTLRFDDPVLPGLPTEPQSGEEGEGHDLRRVTIAQPDLLIASIRKAQTIVVTREAAAGGTLTDDEKSPSTISLSGAAAALLWIDDRQKRIDTETALVRRGPKPARTMPPQPGMSVIVAAKPAKGAVPATLPPALLEKARKDCGDDEKAALEDTSRLGPGLLLYSFTCPGSSGAYNFHDIYYIVPDGKPAAARAVTFTWPIKVGDAEHDGEKSGATNSSFDPKTMTLRAFSKDRGIGDCGTDERWVYDGKAFRLAELKLMSECKGVPPDDWPVLYRATVKR